MLKELLPLALDVRLKNDRALTAEEDRRVGLLCQMLGEMQDEAPRTVRRWPEHGVEQDALVCFNKPRLAGTRLYLYGPGSGGLFHALRCEGTTAGSGLERPGMARELADAVEWAARQWEERQMDAKLGWYRARFDMDYDTGAHLVRMDGPYEDAPALPKDAELAFVFEAISMEAALEQLHDAYRDRMHARAATEAVKARRAEEGQP